MDAAAGLVGGSAFWEQEQRKQQLEEEERMTALAKANAEAVEQKRRRRDEKAAKARAKARERQLEEEIQNMEQLAINAVYSKGASSRLGSRDISVSEFSMPHPRGGDDLLEGTTLSLKPRSSVRLVRAKRVREVHAPSFARSKARTRDSRGLAYYVCRARLER